MGGKGYFNTFALQVHFGVTSQALVIRMFPFSPREGTFLLGNWDLLVGGKEKVERGRRTLALCILSRCAAFSVREPDREEGSQPPWGLSWGQMEAEAKYEFCSACK